MPRDTLLDFFEDFATSDKTFLVHDDGYRVRQMTYRDVAAAAYRFAAWMHERHVRAGDNVVIWSENRIEWVVALWGTLIAGAVLVPIDFRASRALVARVTAIVKAKAVLVGDEVEAAGEEFDAPRWPLKDAVPVSGTVVDAPARLTGSSLAEIIFTSGATADPKGVTITHRNVLANIIPIEREIAKYRRYMGPFNPIRFLNLLPLSHMFGQSMATFVPPMIEGTVVFSHGYSPVEILHQIKSRRISVLVCVPKVLDVIREHVERVAPITKEADVLGDRHWSARWWRYRAVHRLFGWKFWCIVCGAAPLDPELEAYWRKLGFLVVQGYGLTETAPIVTLNHPLRASRGTVGTPIGGVEVKIADDGEILVRGENVTQGYYQPEGGAPVDASAFVDGWFHTGDIGEKDASGRLVIKGRKKEMIVTPQGLNVFPEDVERALIAQSGVRDAAVVGRQVDGEERIHAVVVLEPGASVDAIVRTANATLEDHQRVWSTSIWPGDTLPRTEGTRKLKRKEIQRWAAGEAAGAPATVAAGATVADVVKRFAAGRDVTSATTLDELGLSSLVRVELMMALEDTFQTTLDEATMAEAKTIGDLEAIVKGDGGMPPPASTSAAPATTPDGTRVERRKGPATRAEADPIVFPSWNRTPIAHFIRRVSLPTWILPLAHPFMSLEIRGREHLAGLTTPVIYAANHQSHMDAPTILIGLPRRLRYHVAPAMAKEFFKAHFNRTQYGWKAWFTNSLNYYLSSEFFNAFPLPQREAGTRQTLRYIGEVLASGYSVLIFPEGKRTQQGEIAPFRPGVGMIASRLDVPVVPVRLEGLDKVLHSTAKFPTRGPVRITFGKPLRLSGDDYLALAAEVEQAVRGLGD